MSSVLAGSGFSTRGAESVLPSLNEAVSALTDNFAVLTPSKQLAASVATLYATLRMDEGDADASSLDAALAPDTRRKLRQLQDALLLDDLHAMLVALMRMSSVAQPLSGVLFQLDASDMQAQLQTMLGKLQRYIAASQTELYASVLDHTMARGATRHSDGSTAAASFYALSRAVDAPNSTIEVLNDALSDDAVRERFAGTLLVPCYVDDSAVYNTSKQGGVAIAHALLNAAVFRSSNGNAIRLVDGHALPVQRASLVVFFGDQTVADVASRYLLRKRPPSFDATRVYFVGANSNVTATCPHVPAIAAVALAQRLRREAYYGNGAIGGDDDDMPYTLVVPRVQRYALTQLLRFLVPRNLCVFEYANPPVFAADASTLPFASVASDHAVQMQLLYLDSSAAALMGGGAVRRYPPFALRLVPGDMPAAILNALLALHALAFANQLEQHPMAPMLHLIANPQTPLSTLAATLCSALQDEY